MDIFYISAKMSKGGPYVFIGSGEGVEFYKKQLKGRGENQPRATFI